MAIDIAELKKMAKLSRLHIHPEKAESLCAEINAMFKFVDQLDKIEVDNVAPFVSGYQQSMLMRPDVVTDGNIAEDILKNAPSKFENFFLVPKVIE